MIHLGADKTLGRSVGLFCATAALLLFLAWAWLWPGGILCAASGALMLIASVAALTHVHEVSIEPDIDIVEQRKSVFFLERNRGFLFSRFNAVGVVAALGGDLRPVHLAHMVELRGSSRLLLPGMYVGLPQARQEAQRLAQELGLPLDSRTRTIFWGR